MDHEPQMTVQTEDLSGHTNTPSRATPKTFAGCPRCERQIDRLLRMDEVCWYVGFEPSTIYRKVKNGLFPRSRPLAPGSRNRGWLESEILDWVAERAADTADGEG